MTTTDRRNVGFVATALFASSATLVCCVLPAVMVSLGAGAALVGLISAVPQLVWLSEQKVWVFAISAGLLIASGAMLQHARKLPCPVEPGAARRCMRMRSVSYRLYALAAFIWVAGATFALVLPRLAA